MNDERLPGKIYDGYKVVRIYIDKIDCKEYFMSAFATNAKIMYCENIWVTPLNNCGPLAVFIAEEPVKQFVGIRTPNDNIMSHAVYKCKYKKSQFAELWVRTCRVREAMWCGFPIGTDFADAVMITERII